MLKELDYTPELLTTLRNIGAQGRWQEVRLRLRSIRDQIEEEPWALVLLAEAHAHLDDPASALEVAKEAHRLFRQTADVTGEMKAINEMAIAYFRLGSLGDAEEHFLDLLALAETLNDASMEAKAANNLGALASLRSRGDEALVCYHRALENYARLDDVKGQAQTFHNIAIALRDMGQLSEAEAQFLKAARWARQAGDERLFAFALTAHAELALQHEDLQAAEGASRQAMMRFDTSASGYGMAEAHKLAGMIAAKRGDDEAAVLHLTRGLEQARQLGALLLEAEIVLERGTIRLGSNQPSAARADLERASALFALVQADGKVRYSHTLLSELATDERTDDRRAAASA